MVLVFKLWYQFKPFLRILICIFSAWIRAASGVAEWVGQSFQILAPTTRSIQIAELPKTIVAIVLRPSTDFMKYYKEEIWIKWAILACRDCAADDHHHQLLLAVSTDWYPLSSVFPVTHLNLSPIIQVQHSSLGIIWLLMWPQGPQLSRCDTLMFGWVWSNKTVISLYFSLIFMVSPQLFPKHSAWQLPGSTSHSVDWTWSIFLVWNIQGFISAYFWKQSGL